MTRLELIENRILGFLCAEKLQILGQLILSLEVTKSFMEILAII